MDILFSCRCLDTAITFRICRLWFCKEISLILSFVAIHLCPCFTSVSSCNLVDTRLLTSVFIAFFSRFTGSTSTKSTTPPPPPTAAPLPTHSFVQRRGSTVSMPPGDLDAGIAGRGVITCIDGDYSLVLRFLVLQPF